MQQVTPVFKHLDVMERQSSPNVMQCSILDPLSHVTRHLYFPHPTFVTTHFESGIPHCPFSQNSSSNLAHVLAFMPPKHFIIWKPVPQFFQEIVISAMALHKLSGMF